jgi:dolichol-phosphate mannosyltransferase
VLDRMAPAVRTERRLLGNREKEGCAAGAGPRTIAYDVGEAVSEPAPGAVAVASLVIVPTFNERENLPALVHALLPLDPGLNILVVDDGSPDGTGEIAEELKRETGRVDVIHRTGKQGLGTAYVAGFRYALVRGYDKVLEMDADFSHRPEDLPKLLAAADHADVVIGSRNVPGGRVVGWSPVRQFVSKGGSVYARLLLGLPVHDCTSGFKCFRRSALQVLDLDSLRSNGYAFQVEVNYACAQAGLRFAEVPIVFPDRAQGKSKMSWQIAAEAAWLVLRLRLGLSHASILPSTPRP